MGTKFDRFTAERVVEEIMNRSQGESQVRDKGQEILPNRIGHRRFELVEVHHSDVGRMECAVWKKA
jgi:hypothetical protein